MPVIKVNLSKQRAREIIGDATSSYWLGSYARDDKAWDISRCVLSLREKPRRGSDETDKALRTRVSDRTIAKALETMLNGKDETHRLIAARVLGDIDCDGNTLDAVLQMAVFDRIIYG